VSSHSIRAGHSGKRHLVRGKQGMTKRISNIEQGITNDEVEIATACFAGLAMTADGPQGLNLRPFLLVRV